MRDLSCACRLRCSRAGISRIPEKPSAAGWGSPAGTVSDSVEQKRFDNPEDNDALHPLEELFSELQSDDYIERLEELAESLLREVTADVEASAGRATESLVAQQDTIEKSNDTKGMVGSSSENVETSSTVKRMKTNNDYHYQQPIVENLKTKASRNSESKEIISLKHEIQIKEEPSHDMDTVYGTYDEATNCITIIYPGDDDDVTIQECVQEVCSAENCSLEEQQAHLLRTKKSSINNKYLLSPAYTFTDSLSSPSSIHSEDSETTIANSYKIDSNLSDCGYESHDSPPQPIVREKLTNSMIKNSGNTESSTALNDLWHESFSELFPSLA